MMCPPRGCRILSRLKILKHTYKVPFAEDGDDSQVWETRMEMFMGGWSISQLSPVFKAAGLEETCVGRNAIETDQTPKQTEKEQPRELLGSNMEPSPRQTN